MTKSPVIRVVFVIAVFLAAGAVSAEPASRVMPSEAQLFVDDALIDRMTTVSLHLHRPVAREVALRFDKPWEIPESGYPTVMRAADSFRMYYVGGGEQTREVTCMATSTDGIRWTRPSLGLFEFNGSRENNIVWTGREPAYWESHNFAPFFDTNPDVLPDQRYKAVTLGRYPESDEAGDRCKVLLAFVSPDGIHWERLQSEPIITDGRFDSLNVAFWDAANGQYVCYLRAPRDGYRSVKRAVSSDFVHWSPSEFIDLGPGPHEHLYTNGIFAYFRNPRLYIGLPMRFVPERKTIWADKRKVDGLSDAVLISSHDGLHFHRTFREAFIRPGLNPANWGNAHTNNTPAWGILQTGDDEISVYWCENGLDVSHVRRGTLRLDGFASLHAGAQQGECVTKPLLAQGNRLQINYATSAVGTVRVEIQDVHGRALSGYSLDDCPEIYGDECRRIVEWRGGATFALPTGMPIRLRFVLRDADLYSFQFHE